MFPKISQFLPDDGFAVVIDGRLQATDRHIGAYIDVSTFCPNPEFLENKAFDLVQVRMMESQPVTFNENFMIFEEGNMEYPAIVDPKTMKIALYDDLMDDYLEDEDSPKVDDLRKVIYALTDGQPDVAKIQKRNTHFRGVNLDAQRLLTVAQCFQNQDPGFIRLEFFHAQPAKEKVDKPSAAIVVSPIKTDFPLYAEMAVIMPVF